MNNAQERALLVIFCSACSTREIFNFFIVNFTFTITMGVPSGFSFLGIFEEMTFEYFGWLAPQFSVLFSSHMIITRHSKITVFGFVL